MSQEDKAAAKVMEVVQDIVGEGKGEKIVAMATSAIVENELWFRAPMLGLGSLTFAVISS